MAESDGLSQTLCNTPPLLEVCSSTQHSTNQPSPARDGAGLAAVKLFVKQSARLSADLVHELDLATENALPCEVVNHVSMCLLRAMDWVAQKQWRLVASQLTSTGQRTWAGLRRSVTCNVRPAQAVACSCHSAMRTTAEGCLLFNLAAGHCDGRLSPACCSPRRRRAGQRRRL
jgi:hypothetical protein